MFVLPDLLARTIPNVISETLAGFAGLVTVHLYTNDFTPDKNSVLADFTEVSAVVMASYTPAFFKLNGVTFRRLDGSWVPAPGSSPALFVSDPAPTAPVTVYGFFLQNFFGAGFYGSGRFAAPFVFQSKGDGFDLDGFFSGLFDDLSGAFTLPDPQPQ